MAIAFPSQTVSTRSRIRMTDVASNQPRSLLHRVADGDMSAMQECIDEYGGLIWTLARRMSTTPTEAEDAVQEVFIALWENAERFDATKGTEVTFVAMITRRRLVDRLRKVDRERRAMDRVRTQAESDPVTQDNDAPWDGDEVAQVQEAIGMLSPSQQRVLQLSVHHGYTHEQIARITELPLGTVKTHARRGLIRVRQLLNDRQSGEAARAEP